MIHSAQNNKPELSRQLSVSLSIMHPGSICYQHVWRVYRPNIKFFSGGYTWLSNGVSLWLKMMMPSTRTLSIHSEKTVILCKASKAALRLYVCSGLKSSMLSLAISRHLEPTVLRCCSGYVPIVLTHAWSWLQPTLLPPLVRKLSKLV